MLGPVTEGVSSRRHNVGCGIDSGLGTHCCSQHLIISARMRIRRIGNRSRAPCVRASHVSILLNNSEKDRPKEHLFYGLVALPNDVPDEILANPVGCPVDIGESMTRDDWVPRPGWFVALQLSKKDLLAFRRESPKRVVDYCWTRWRHILEENDDPHLGSGGDKSRLPTGSRCRGRPRLRCGVTPTPTAELFQNNSDRLGKCVQLILGSITFARGGDARHSIELSNPSRGP